MPFPLAGAGLIFGWTLLALAWIDIRNYLLPNILTIPLGLAGLTLSMLLWVDRFPAHVMGAVSGYALLTIVALTYRELFGRDGLGLGDAKLLGAIGAWVGWQGLGTTLLVAALGGLAFVLILKASGRDVRRDQAIPFGPFLALGGWIVWLYGPMQMV